MRTSQLVYIVSFSPLQFPLLIIFPRRTSYCILQTNKISHMNLRLYLVWKISSCQKPLSLIGVHFLTSISCKLLVNLGTGLMAMQSFHYTNILRVKSAEYFSHVPCAHRLAESEDCSVIMITELSDAVLIGLLNQYQCQCHQNEYKPL